MNTLKLCVIVAASIMVAAACNQNATVPNVGKSNSAVSTPAPPSPAPTPVDEVGTARDLYTTNCMTCHRDSGKGGKVTVEGKTINPDDITTAKQKAKTDEKIYSYISDGFPDEGMPAFKDKLTDAEIKSIIKHVRTLQAK